MFQTQADYTGRTVSKICGVSIVGAGFSSAAGSAFGSSLGCITPAYKQETKTLYGDQGSTMQRLPKQNGRIATPFPSPLIPSPMAELQI
jgi:hypothetical protein